jgi:hypothetical protein
MTQPPDGFAPHFRSSGLTDPWEPIFVRRAGKMIVLGLRAILAVLRTGKAHGVVSLALDYLGVAQQGQWLTFETEFVRVGSTLSFAQAFVRADGAVCARANATFRVFKAAPKPDRPQSE